MVENTCTNDVGVGAVTWVPLVEISTQSLRRKPTVTSGYMYSFGAVTVTVRGPSGCGTKIEHASEMTLSG